VLQREVKYRRQTRALAAATVFLLLVFAIVIPLLAPLLEGLAVAGWPLGYFVSSIGSLAGFVLCVFWFARRQEAIDDEHAVAED